MADPTENVLVIGGLSPIGKEVTRSLVNMHKKVYFTGNDEKRLNEHQEQLNKSPQQHPSQHPSRKVVVDMANLNSIGDLDIYNITFDTIIVIFDPPHEPSDHSSEIEDIKILHPLFLETVMVPYLLIRFIVEKSLTKKIRFIFVTDLEEDKTLPTLRKDILNFDKFFRKQDGKDKRNENVSEEQLRTASQLGLAFHSEYLNSIDPMQSIIVNSKGMNNIPCAIIVMKQMKNYPLRESKEELCTKNTNIMIDDKGNTTTVKFGPRYFAIESEAFNNYLKHKTDRLKTDRFVNP